jgi:uncharacterized protein
MSIELVIVFLFLGSVVGILAGLLGIGGGGIMVPALVSIFIYQGVPKEAVMHLALGTTVACIILTSLSSMRSHSQNGAVNWTLVKPMSVGIVIGTFSATFLTAYLSSKVLALFFAVFMAYVAVQMFIKKQTQHYARDIKKSELRVVSLCIGGISALVSIGGGSLTVPYLTWRGVNIKNAIGTSSALGFYISLAGTFGYFINGILNQAHGDAMGGYIYWPALLLVSITSYLTAPYGAKLTQKLPVQTLKKIFGILLMTLSLKMAASFL